MVDMKAKPFYLSDSDCDWVTSTLAGMSEEDKIGQIFCLISMIPDTEELKSFIRGCRPGGCMCRTGSAHEIQASLRAMQDASDIPMLLAANLESGGNGAAREGTYFAKQMQVAATGDTTEAYRLGLICGREGGAVGCNWSFAPIVDIDYNWRNPITNVRTYGSDPTVVRDMAAAYMDGVRDSGVGMAVCIKHFPGDGVDERDQHLLASVNSLSADEWQASYGMVYGSLIDNGAQTVMIGHILQPAMVRQLCPGIDDKDIFPASTDKHLLTKLLRQRMGFNGLIVTDATPMVGFSAALPRAQAIRQSLMAGADMILFTRNLNEDFAAIRDGLADGSVTMERIDEAVTRVLALKASLRLHDKQRSGTLVPTPDALNALGCDEHIRWARECADKAITLVKDTQDLLPVTPEKYRRIRLTVLGENEIGSFGDNAQIGGLLKARLEKVGFEVSLYDYATLERGEIFRCGASELRDRFDLSLVAANIGTGSNNTTRRVDWIPMMAANAPWYAREIPTMFVSFANPHHMIDVPYISTFVNCYSSNEYCVDAFVEKLIGGSTFMGRSPSDPWCGDIFGAKWM